MDKEELLYRLKYLNWRLLLTVKHNNHKLIIRALIDEGGKMYPKMKPIRYDDIIDGVTGPDAGSIAELDRIMRRNFKGIILRMWNMVAEELEVII